MESICGDLKEDYAPDTPGVENALSLKIPVGHLSEIEISVRRAKPA